MTVIIIGLVPALLLLSGSALLFFKTKTEPTLLQLLGTGCLMVVVIAHVCEASGLFPWMGWGRPDSAGHYLDLVSAVIALTLFPVARAESAPATNDTAARNCYIGRGGSKPGA